MRFHDFHLTAYEVRQFGAEIVLHLEVPGEQSHIRFADVELYHFVHIGGAIILDIEQVPIPQILDEFWERIAHWASQYGGLRHWEGDDRASYKSKLQAAGLQAWVIDSAIGFAGFVIAKSIEDVTDQVTQN